ncbi:MAG: hypothetical protein ACRD26_12885 [Vicinamibacterales bacterium]
MLFSDRSLWTMMHGIVLGGAALMALFAALFAMRAMYPADGAGGAVDRQSRSVAQLTVLVAAILWVAVLTGTYVVFPPYRAAPPPGVTDLAAYPRSMLLANPDTAWLHAFAMESKEHMPWIASMLATAVAFVAVRCRSTLLADARMHRMAMALLAICFALVSFTALMGIFVNKVAPLE